ncbi:MAG: long-chain fatty acid--CoA ligase, partial [Alphaproteobacteria bacterium]
RAGDAAGAGLTEAAILAAFLERFPKWQVPDAIRFVDALPLTPTGKIDKRALRAEWRTASAGA